MMPVLSLQNFGVRFGERTILKGIDLDIAPRQIFVLLGPGGAGKSTLLRTICGYNDSQSAITIEGDVLYRGEPRQGENQPAMVTQRAELVLGTVTHYLFEGHPMRGQLTPRQMREYIEDELDAHGLYSLRGCMDDDVIDIEPSRRRLLAIVRAVAANPALLCIDEPTAGLDDDDAGVILDFINRQADHRSILLITHNQRQARAIGHVTALLAGGRILECAPTEEFFNHPKTKPAREFIRTGGCAVPGPDSDPSTLDPLFVEEYADVLNIEREGPGTTLVLDDAADRERPISGFHWVYEHLLAGTPQPGLFMETDNDYRALRARGIEVLVTLTEKPLPAGEAEAYGFEVIHFPIIDMDAPQPGPAAELCRQILGFTKVGRPVALHCRAGVGRTGTLLAALLIWQGRTGKQALQEVRAINRWWVQSRKQEEFLETFHTWLGENPPDSKQPHSPQRTPKRST